MPNGRARRFSPAALAVSSATRGITGPESAPRPRLSRQAARWNQHHYEYTEPAIPPPVEATLHWRKRFECCQRENSTK